MCNEGWVWVLKEMCCECVECCECQGKVSFQLESVDKFGKQVIVVEYVSFVYFGGQLLVCDFFMVLQCGDCIGLFGVNGIGKIILFKLLFGDLQLILGKIEVGIKLEVVYFDQLCYQFEFEQMVIDNIFEGCEFIIIDGQNWYVFSYFGDFLFSLQCVCILVKVLFGGECVCLLLVKLFSKLVNLLVFDELINDFDVEILELLEEVLFGFQGIVLMVSYDWVFFDNVVISILVFEGEGKVCEFVGGYQDWLC